MEIRCGRFRPDRQVAFLVVLALATVVICYQAASAAEEEVRQATLQRELSLGKATAAASREFKKAAAVLSDCLHGLKRTRGKLSRLDVEGKIKQLQAFEDNIGKERKEWQAEEGQAAALSFGSSSIEAK